MPRTNPVSVEKYMGARGEHGALSASHSHSVCFREIANVHIKVLRLRVYKSIATSEFADLAASTLISVRAAIEVLAIAGSLKTSSHEEKPTLPVL
eukprot:1161353-Pelagomonas_calceolata.AAC.2